MARTADPNGSIVRFFMTKPLALAQQALSTAKTIVATRTANEAAPAAVVKRKRVRKPRTTTATTTAPASTTLTTAPVTPVDVTLTPAVPRRRRPPVVTPANPTGAMPPLGTGTTAAGQ